MIHLEHKRLREDKNITQKEIAEQAGVSRSSIVRYEQGISQRGGTFRKIIKAYKEIK